MSWQAQHFVDLGVQISWQAQHLRTSKGKCRCRRKQETRRPETELNQPESGTKWSLIRKIALNRVGFGSNRTAV